MAEITEGHALGFVNVIAENKPSQPRITYMAELNPAVAYKKKELVRLNSFMAKENRVNTPFGAA